MKKTFISSGIFVLLATSLLLASCGKDNIKPPPTIVNLEIRASSDLNPDTTGRPSPVVIKIYALKSLGKFSTADFDSLYNDIQAQLGADLISQDELHLTPGGQKIVSKELSADAHFIGVMAAYRDIDNAIWRASVPVPGERTTNYSVIVNANAISIRAE